MHTWWCIQSQRCPAFAFSSLKCSRVHSEALLKGNLAISSSVGRQQSLTNFTPYAVVYLIEDQHFNVVFLDIQCQELHTNQPL